jgi:hypothetical protein
LEVAMSRAIVVLFAVAGLLSGNPILVKLLSEFQVAPDSLERVELNPSTYFYESLDGWRLVTSAGTALIDSGYILEDTSSYLVLDRSNLIGPFGLDDSGGTITLLAPDGHPFDEVAYPGNAGANTGEAWVPPAGMSCCREYWGYWRYPDWIDCYDWYLDATPTFGERNDDCGTRISGTVRASGGGGLDGARVRVSSVFGYEEAPTRAGWDGYYELYPGFGTFLVTAEKGGYLPGAYPDSIAVEPGDSLSDIDIYLDPVGIEEPDAPIVTWRPGRLVFTSLYPVQAEVGLFEPDGRRLWRSSLSIGERTEMKLPGLRAGVKFCRIAYDGRVARRKLTIP